jgi:1-acyl-sn-glycerol-3-phosphate acyltransferase
MSQALIFTRALLEIINSLFFSLLGFILIPLPYKLKARSGKYILRIWAWLSCRIFGIQVKTIGSNKNIKAGTLVISNHVSYLDIFILGSLFSAVFLSKAEVKKIPIIGLAAWALGVHFVNRESIHSGAKSIRSLAKGLGKGATIIAFPEGTTTNLEELRGFKLGSFHAASIAKIPVQIVSINYENFAEEGWQDEKFFNHFARMASKWTHRVYVVFGKYIEDAPEDPRELRAIAFASLKDAFEKAQLAKKKIDRMKP